jgi:hypothetical protein
VDSAVEWRREARDCSLIVPRPNHAGRKNKVFFFGANPLNAQRTPDFGHENGIIHPGKWRKMFRKMFEHFCHAKMFRCGYSAAPKYQFVPRGRV